MNKTKEQEFNIALNIFNDENKEYPIVNKIEIEVYYGLNDDEEVVIDESSIREEFETKLKKILNLSSEY